MHDRVRSDIHPSIRQALAQIVANGRLAKLIAAGSRVHRPGCNGCIGMGGAPVEVRLSLRKVPCNIPGRSNTIEDSVYLCSFGSAAASVLIGIITSSRDVGVPHRKIVAPKGLYADQLQRVPPVSLQAARATKLGKTSSIVSLPELGKSSDGLASVVPLKADDEISTECIMPAGSGVLPS